jgi:hypothetical protein
VGHFRKFASDICRVNQLATILREFGDGNVGQVGMGSVIGTRGGRVLIAKGYASAIQVA